MAEMAAAAWAAAKAAAGYIAASFKAVAAGTATAGQVATYAAVTVGVSVATTAVAQAMNKPNVGGRAPGEWVADPNAGIPFAIGSRIGVGGNMVYKNTFGKDNEYKGIVTVVSGAGPITSYLGFTADREAITFSGENAVGRYADQMWMRRSLGNQPDTALIDPGLPGWGASYKLSGKAHFLWTLKQDSKFSVYPQGEPAPVHVVSGIKGYDPRYDSTHPGGSGDCRLGVRSTYRTIANPIIADLNWCLGLVENGKVVGGLGVSSAGIDWPAYVRAANVSDANGWSVAAYPRSDEPKTEVRIAFLQAGGAVISRKAGLVSCVSRGAPKTPVMTLTVADTAGPIEIDTAANVLNRLNTIVPRYLSETHDWQLVAAAPVSSSVYVAEDRGRVRSDQRDYPYVPSAKQAAELAALDVANSREGIAGRWPLKAHCRHLEPGDVFTVDEPGMLLDGMDFLVLHREIDPATTTVYVTFVSETAGKVEWALGRTANPPPTPSLAARHDLVAPGAPAWEVTLPTPVPGAVTVPSGTISIEIDNARAEDLIVEKGPSNTGPWKVIQNVKITDGELQVPINDLKPNEVFWIALSYRSVDEGTSARTIKGPYTASGLVAQDVIPTAPSLVALDERIDDAFGATAAVAGDLAAAELVVEATQAELVAARQGSPNLSANITGIKTTVETEAMTRASEINRVEAKTGIRNNLVPNSTGVRGGAGWVLSGGWFAGDLGWAWGHGFKITTPGTAYMYTDPAALIEWPANTKGVLSFDALMLGRTAGRLRVYVQWHTPTGTLTSDFVYIEADRDFGERLSMEVESPATTTHAYIVANTEDFAGSQVAIRQIKLERGLLPATAWTDDATEAGVAASVTQHSQAIYDLEGKAALAEWQVKTDATGGKPAVLRLVSSSVGSGVIIDGEFLYFGPNTTLDPATNTLQTLVGSNRRVLALGAPIGASGDIVEWWGPASEPLSNMSRLNGFNGRMTVAPYVFDNVSGQSFAVKCSHTVVAASRVGAGTVTSPVVTFEVAGAVGPVQFDVYLMNGDGSITAVNPSASDTSAPFQHQTVFSTSVTVTQIKTARFICSARDANGNTGTAVVAVSLRENT